MMPLLYKWSNEDKDKMIMGNFNVNLINSNDDKTTSNFHDAMFSHKNIKAVVDIIFYNKPLNDIMSGNLSSTISDHLNQFLTEPFNFTKVSSQIDKSDLKSFDKLMLRTDLIKVS